MAPGPRVTKQMPGLPVSLPWQSAIIAAPPSWRQTIVRIGESFLISFSFNVDAAKGSTGFTLNIEPRFLPSTRIGRVGGAQIPPAGAFGLE